MGAQLFPPLKDLKIPVPLLPVYTVSGDSGATARARTRLLGGPLVVHWLKPACAGIARPSVRSIPQRHRTPRTATDERAAIDMRFPVLALFAMAHTIAADIAEEQISPDASRAVRR